MNAKNGTAHHVASGVSGSVGWMAMYAVARPTATVATAASSQPMRAGLLVMERIMVSATSVRKGRLDR